MLNVILSCDQCEHDGYCKSVGKCKQAVAIHLLKVLEEPCTDPSHSCNSTGLNTRGWINGVLRWSCPECIAEIKQELEI